MSKRTGQRTRQQTKGNKSSNSQSPYTAQPHQPIANNQSTAHIIDNSDDTSDSSIATGDNVPKQQPFVIVPIDNISNNDDDDENMSKYLTPASFHGLSSEDSEKWLTSIGAWMILAKVTEENQTIAAFTLLLKDSARIWFDSITPKPTTMAGLTALFVEQFKRDDATVWRDVRRTTMECHSKKGTRC